MRRLFILSLIVILAQGANAQFETKKNDLSLSYGVVTIAQVIDVVSDIAGEVFTLGNVTTKNREFSGAIGLQYAYQPVRWFGIGAAAVFERSTADVYQHDELKGTTKVNYFTLMPIAKFNWFDFKVFGMYSKLGAGYTFRNSETNNIETAETDKSNSDMVAFQFSPVCMQIGTPSIRAFAELGVGSQGILNVGVRYRF